MDRGPIIAAILKVSPLLIVSTRSRFRWGKHLFELQVTSEFMDTVDDHQTYYYLEMASDCWLFVRLQFLTSVFIGALSLLTVFYRNSRHASAPEGKCTF